MMRPFVVNLKHTCMQHYSSNSKVNYIYPGEYTPLPELEELATQLKLHKEGIVLQPLVNVRDRAESFTVEVAIPGVKRENFLIEVKDRILSIALFAKKSVDCITENFHLHEFNYECFERRLYLPDCVNPELASAFYKDGLLQIFIPKEAIPISTKTLRIVVY
jgi:HSP20 family protein